ncbi:hypothetical protein F5Y09DRAFT_35308 [Xylaria sp. FL1042]|nr:hypothetical protein F5Y09DRAFT_35308 [Xylaria sp. FL1042]
MATSFYRDWFSLILEVFRTRGGLFWLVVSPLLYILCRIAVRRFQGSHKARSRGDVETMTLEEAYSIKARIADEFPTVFSTAINFVFFKAEGIPSIAKLVARAAQRSSSAPQKTPQRPRRGAGVAPGDLLGRPGAAETKAAIDRVNHVHSFYRPSGKMSDDDLLYVLSLFALEPMRWIDRLEGRRLTELERCALATLWKALGEELRIPFDKLPSCAEGGFRDTLHWLAELEDWGRMYEERNREKSPESKLLAQKQLDAWVGGIPGVFRPTARCLVAAFIEPRLRRAMGIETPSATAIFLIETMIYVRKFIRRCSYG